MFPAQLLATAFFINAITTVFLPITKSQLTDALRVSIFACITILRTSPFPCTYVFYLFDTRFVIQKWRFLLPSSHISFDSSLPSAHSVCPSHTHNCGMHFIIPSMHEKYVALQSKSSGTGYIWNYYVKNNCIKRNVNISITNHRVNTIFKRNCC